MRIYRKPLPSVTNIQPPKRMDIWYAHLRENTGTSVQEGDRPVLVISNDVANRCSDVVTVLPMTSQIKKMYMPTHCIISDLLDEDSGVGRTDHRHSKVEAAAKAVCLRGCKNGRRYRNGGKSTTWSGGHIQ